MALDAQLMERLFNSPQLPSLPAIALQIIDLVQQDEVNVDKIAETVSLDPALSSKMLKTVNSSFYGLPKTVGSVHQAVVVLGLNSVKTLALGFSLVSNLTGAGGEGFDHMRFWRRSLYSAAAAKQLCESLNIVQAEEVFMASLLQDVGMLALSQVMGESYTTLMKKTAEGEGELSVLEQAAFGGTHMDVGAALAESWGLPPLLVESIRLHESPDESPENLLPLIRVVAAGALAADLIERPDDESSVAEYFGVLESWFGLELSSAKRLLQDVFKNAGDVQRLFELPTGELASPESIMSKAHEVLTRIAVEGGSSPAGRRSEQRSGTADSHESARSIVDHLTGLGTRKEFVKQMEQQFAAASVEQPLSLIFVDIDHFKQINDLYGIPAGDAALVAIAEHVSRVMKDQGVVFHYEEDAFSVLCSGLSQCDSALLAERLRAELEQASIELGETGRGKQASATLSIGVATYEGEQFKSAKQLLDTTRRASAAAKDAGGNLVRVFVPRKRTQSRSDAA